MPDVVSKKLKFKGDKPKKKKRSHREAEDPDEELAAMAAADPRGWVYPEDVMEINGPSFVILPTEPPTCLAWDAGRQRVYAAPIDFPEAPEGANDLSHAEVLAAVEPSDVHHVWVISRLSGSEGIVSLRTSSGTFLTASPSGVLTATTPSRGPLESFVPSLTPSPTSPFPTLTLQSHSEKYFSATTLTGSAPTILKSKAELRADADVVGEGEGLRIKCQREFVLKAKMAMEDAKEGKGRTRVEGGPAPGSLEDEMRKNRETQAWGAGRAIVSEGDRKEIKRAKKEGRLAEAMLDRRAALKSDRYAK